MERSNLLVLVLLIIIVACNKKDEIPPVTVNESCAAYIPFHEQQDSTATALNIECICEDDFVDLGTKLLPYSNVERIDFNCDESQFDKIPNMPSVTHLTSNVTTENILAFPNLEVYKNKSYMEKPLTYQLSSLPKLREVVLFNAMNFPDFFINEIPLDVFRMTFQGIPDQNITLPSNLHVLKNLKELNIRNLELAIFTNYENLVSLESLELVGVRWVRVPEIPNQWPKLKSLELSEIDLRRDIPDIFSDMDSLERVYISATPVSANTLRHICKSPNLKELTLSFCEFESIPEELGNLTNLNHLIITTDQNLINNPIELPLSVGNLSNLKSIFISTNTNEFPTGLLELKSTLEELAIEDNIGNVPSEIGGFTALKILKLNNCGLVGLPSEIQDLSDILETLFLTGNSFDEATKQQIEAWLPNTTVYF